MITIKIIIKTFQRSVLNKLLENDVRVNRLFQLRSIKVFDSIAIRFEIFDFEQLTVSVCLSATIFF